MKVSETTLSKIHVGSVLGRSFSVLIRNIIPFGTMAIIFYAPIAYARVQVFELVDYFGEYFKFILILFGLGMMALGFLLSATLVYGTVSELRGRHVDIFECIRRGVGLLLPVIGVGLVVSLIVGFGMALFVIPGIFALMMLWVAVPVAVVERLGVMGSLSRSLELTKDNRWRLFVLALIMYAFTELPLEYFFVEKRDIFLALDGAAERFGVDELIFWNLSKTLAVVINAIAFGCSGAIFAVVSAVVYHDLRIAKEGVSTEQIAAIFD